MSLRSASVGGLLIALAVSGCARALGPVHPVPSPSPGGAPPVDIEALLARAESLYAARDPAQVREAADLWLQAAQARPADVRILVALVRARVWLVDHEPAPGDREAAARRAVEAAQWCDRAAPQDAACAYWMGAALGVQARERRATAVDALPRIVEAFRRALAGDPAQEEAGPDRALALLYLRAPGWPSGPGDPDLGLEHARAAVDREPLYPPNLTALGEALEKTDDPAGSREAYGKALSLAKERAAAGDPDADEWIEEIQGKLAGRRRAP